MNFLSQLRTIRLPAPPPIFESVEIFFYNKGVLSEQTETEVRRIARRLS